VHCMCTACIQHVKQHMKLHVGGTPVLQATFCSSWTCSQRRKGTLSVSCVWAVCALTGGLLCVAASCAGVDGRPLPYPTAPISFTFAGAASTSQQIH
jgi:hypothetical protein